ncbi:MAG: DUF484 family protein [Gammaproteobacteria bacterium]|nr:DUF484 family protein [Gammaproteobacteria bacterium]
MDPEKDFAAKANEIIDYLRKHPDFFIKHSEILPELKITHKTDKKVSSIIEYQVSHLRTQLNELQKTLHMLEQNTKANSEFSKRVHTMSLQLHAASDIKELFDTLYKGLKLYYSANKVLLLIFKKPEGLKNYSGLKFLNSTSQLRFMFTEIFHRNKPLCESLHDEYLDVLFGKDSEMIKSTVLIPLQQSDWNGLLVLGSHERNQYSQGFELDLLVYIASICGLVMDSFLKSH